MIKIRYMVAMGYATANGTSRQTIPKYAAPIMNAMIKRWPSFESFALFENPWHSLYILALKIFKACGKV